MSLISSVAFVPPSLVPFSTALVVLTFYPPPSSVLPVDASSTSNCERNFWFYFRGQMSFVHPSLLVSRIIPFLSPFFAFAWTTVSYCLFDGLLAWLEGRVSALLLPPEPHLPRTPCVKPRLVSERNLLKFSFRVLTKPLLSPVKNRHSFVTCYLDSQ